MLKKPPDEPVDVRDFRCIVVLASPVISVVTVSAIVVVGTVVISAMVEVVVNNVCLL